MSATADTSLHRAPASTPPRRTGPVVAMVGAGQLARMTHQAAIPLGVTLRVLAADEHDPAVLAGAPAQIGSPERLDDVRALAAGADVLTFDHERIPQAVLSALTAEGVCLAPSADAKRLAQDKLHARRALAERGFPVPPFAHATDVVHVCAFAEAHGWPLVAKAPRGGYDGRGVFWLDSRDSARQALLEHPDGLLLEPSLTLERELAVLIACSRNGEQIVYPVVETVQEDGMCREIIAPAPVTSRIAEQAQALAGAIAQEFALTGIVALELFATREGLIVNELALRPHNSGHYTIEGCATSQFEQHLRAALGWPLGLPALLAPHVVTVNVVGPADGSDPVTRLPEALAVPGAHVHLYEKAARPGRKLGHVTVCGQEPEPTRRAARLAAALLQGDER